MTVTRRSFVAAALPFLAACTTPLALGPRPPSDADASRRFDESAEAHGLVAYRRLADVSVGYAGRWRPLIDGIQPALVDAGYRGASEERLIPSLGVVAQAYAGPSGTKQVSWRRGNEASAAEGRIAVWRNGRVDDTSSTRDAAALVADAYGMFLLGPLWFLDRAKSVRRGGQAQVDGRPCDIVDLWVVPGLGAASLDRVSMYLDRRSSLVRRFRFTLEGTSNTRGAVAEVDTFEHERRFGITWPMRSFERVVHPIRLPAHDWRITGLDVDRGFGPDDLEGPRFGGKAAAPAAPLAEAAPVR